MRSDISLLRRLGAIIYDLFLAFSLAFFLIGVVLIAFFDEKQIHFALFGLYLTAIYFYFAWSWVKGGKTLGMAAWKFKVVQDNGEKITHKQAFIRFCMAFVSFALFGLGYVYQWFNKNNLSLHDQVSGTRLIKN